MKRIFIGLSLGCLLGIGLMHWVLGHRFAGLSEGRAERGAMIAARAVAAVAAAHGDVAAWAKAHPNVKAYRVVNVDERSIEATTFREDLANGQAPRQMIREEKPLYDLGRELSTNIDTNLEEHAARKDEVSVVRNADRTLLIAVPIEHEGSVTGYAQVQIVPTAGAVHAPTPWIALAFALVPMIVMIAIAPVLKRREKTGIAIAIVLLLAAIFAYRQLALSSLVSDARRAEGQFARMAADEATITGVDNAIASTWDADVYRRPVKIDVTRAVAGETAVVTNASWGIAISALLVTLLFALGVVARLGATLVRHRQAYAFVAPAIFAMILLVFLPVLYAVTLSFTSQNIYSMNKPLPEIWVGVQNYIDILSDFRFDNQSFYWTLCFTILWTIANVSIGVTVGLLLALILNTKNFRAKTVYRVLLILPWAVPTYITALVWKGMFHQQFGVINQVLQIVGLNPISWFASPFASFCAVVATNGWLSFSFMMVVALGALQSIPADLYEAARVDGATRWQQFTAITLPSLKPALVPAVILSVIWTFNQFIVIYLVSAGEPAGSTEILITQAYKVAFEQYRYGYAAAYSTIIFMILLMYGIFQNRVTRATESIA